jgi:hypothetical protein
VGTKVRSQPLQSKEIKYLQQFDSKGFTEGLSSRQWILTNFKSKYLCSIGQKVEKTSQTSGFQTANQRRDFSGYVAFWYQKGTSELSKVSPKTALQGLSPDGLHGRVPNLHIFFCNNWNSVSLG